MKFSQSHVNLVEDQSLTQMVDILTRKERTLHVDLILTTNLTLVNSVTTLLLLTTVMNHSIIVFKEVDTRAVQPKSSHGVDWQGFVLIY